MRNLLLLSNSTLHGTEYLEYASTEIISFLKTLSVSKVLFVPYALKDHETYTEKVKAAFNRMGFDLYGIHKSKSPVQAVNDAQAVYVGGGNTFLLLKTLYDNQLVDAIRKRVQNGMPYMGASAGTNVATISICTTNDMPIVHPPSLNALGLVPFNINPHYMDPDPNSKHMGETREMRIKEYHEIGGKIPVVGLREGSMLHVTGDKIHLKGKLQARIFFPGEEPKEHDADSDLSFILAKCP